MQFLASIIFSVNSDHFIIVKSCLENLDKLMIILGSMEWFVQISTICGQKMLGEF